MDKCWMEPATPDVKPPTKRSRMITVMFYLSITLFLTFFGMTVFFLFALLGKLMGAY
jgi:hypothetical protein